MRSETSSGVGNTAVMTRRILAGAVDSLVVLGPWFIVLRIVTESFPVNRSDSGIPQLSAADQQRIDEIADGINRSQEAGGTLYTLSGFGLWFSTLFLVAAVIGAMIVMPLVLDGQTAGKKLFSLRTVAIDGSAPMLPHYVGRLIGGFADFFPFFVPGIVGWIVASQDEERQRLGDQLGRTLVVDDHSIPRIKQTSDSAESDNVATTSAEASKSDEEGTRLARKGPATRLLDSGSGAIAAKTVLDAQGTNSSTSMADGTVEKLEKVDFYYAQDQNASEPATQETDEDADGSQQSRRGDRSAQKNRHPTLRSMLGEAPDAESNADDFNDQDTPKSNVGEIGLAGMPRPGNLGMDSTGEYSRGSVSGEVEPQSNEHADDDSSITLSGLKVLLREDSPDVDIAEEPTSQPMGDVQSDFASGDVGDSSPAPIDQATTTPVSQSGGTAPEWSEGWQAWLSWDKANKQWLRHDQETEKWTPI